MEQRLGVVTLGVKNVAKAHAFYEAMGWKAAFLDQDVAFFQLNGFVLSLFEKKGMAKDANVPEEKLLPGATALAYNTRSRPEVDEVLAQAKANGAQILKSAQETFWGGYAGYFADLDGNFWEVAHNPFWPIDEKGNVRYQAPK